MRNKLKNLTRLFALLLALGLVVTSGCGDDDDPGDDVTAGDGDGDGDDNEENEVITTLTLEFTPSAGGDTLTFEFDDPDGEGPGAPVINDIELAANTEYTVDVSFTNKLENPAEDITEEIQDEAEEHFIFFFGESVSGPASTATTELATHAYADVESDYGTNAEGDDLPVGLVNTVTTTATGTGSMTVVLRHMPPESGTVVKLAGVPGEVQTAGDVTGIAGSDDINVDFVLTVQ